MNKRKTVIILSGILALAISASQLLKDNVNSEKVKAAKIELVVTKKKAGEKISKKEIDDLPAGADFSELKRALAAIQADSKKRLKLRDRIEKLIAKLEAKKGRIALLKREIDIIDSIQELYQSNLNGLQLMKSIPPKKFRLFLDFLAGNQVEGWKEFSEEYFPGYSDEDIKSITVMTGGDYNKDESIALTRGGLLQNFEFQKKQLKKIKKEVTALLVISTELIELTKDEKLLSDVHDKLYPYHTYLEESLLKIEDGLASTDGLIAETQSL